MIRASDLPIPVRYQDDALGVVVGKLRLMTAHEYEVIAVDAMGRPRRAIADVLNVPVDLPYYRDLDEYLDTIQNALPTMEIPR